MTKDAVDKSKLLVTTKDRTLAENKDQYQLFIDKYNKSQKVSIVSLNDSLVPVSDSYIGTCLTRHLYNPVLSQSDTISVHK